MMRPIVIQGIQLVPVNLQMRQTFVTTLGRKDVSHNLLVTVRLSDGAVGYGEASASLAMPDQTQAAMAAALRRLAPCLIGRRAADLRALAATAWAREPDYPTALAALECAWLDALCRSRGVPMWRCFGPRPRVVSTSLTIPAWPPPVAARAVRAARRAGIRRFKIKITADAEDGLARVMAVHRAAPRAALVVDANQAFAADAAIRFAQRLTRERLPVRFLEQPVARDDWEGLAVVHDRSPIPILVDESVGDAAAARHVLRHRLADGINIKLAKTGLLGALDIIRMAWRAGCRLMIGCMAESRIGLAASIHLACGSGLFDWVDLDSHRLVESPPCRGGFTDTGGRLRVSPTRPGTGVTIRR